MSTNKATPRCCSLFSQAHLPERKGKVIPQLFIGEFTAQVACPSLGRVFEPTLLRGQGWLLPSSSQTAGQPQIISRVLGWTDCLCGPALQSTQPPAQASTGKAQGWFVERTNSLLEGLGCAGSSSVPRWAGHREGELPSLLSPILPDVGWDISSAPWQMLPMDEHRGA